jgi:threonyl-tRNA synthetase
LWLSPVQVVVATISERSEHYARRVYEVCRDAGLRVQLDVSPDKIGAKIRTATLAKIPYVLVIGEQETADRTVNVRHRTRGQQGSFHPEQFLAAVTEEIRTRAL